MKIRTCTALLALSLAATGSWAKLPPPTEEEAAKAAAAKEKAAETAKREAELLGKAQDRVAEAYLAKQKAQSGDKK